jgi:hypothetical protein
MAANPTPDLRDIHLPDPLSIWPLAIGWYVLAALILLGLILCLSVIIRRRRFTRARRAALAELARIQTNDISQLSMLLRRTALAYYKQANIEAITGKAWIEFLKATHKKPLFNEDDARLLTEASYQKNAKSTPALTAKCRRWIKSCGDVRYV